VVGKGLMVDAALWILGTNTKKSGCHLRRLKRRGQGHDNRNTLKSYQNPQNKGCR
jgi:hypothetical protein